MAREAMTRNQNNSHHGREGVEGGTVGAPSALVRVHDTIPQNRIFVCPFVFITQTSPVVFRWV